MDLANRERMKLFGYLSMTVQWMTSMHLVGTNEFFGLTCSWKKRICKYGSIIYAA